MHRFAPVRLAAGILLLAAGPLSPAFAGVISDVGAIPNPFSPNADGVFDSTAIYYTLSETAAVVVSVTDFDYAELLTLWSGWEDPGGHSHWWNGVVGAGTVPDGDYRFLIEAIPQGGGVHEAEFLFTVDTEPPAVQALEVVPSRFSPDGDGVGDSLRVSFVLSTADEADEVGAQVVDQNDAVVAALFHGVGVESAVTYWDGTDGAGALADDGLYFVIVSAIDAAGNSSADGALVDLDTAPPELGVAYTDTLLLEVRVSEETAEIHGWAADRAGVTSVEVSTDQEDWTEVSLGRADTVNWHHDLSCDECVPDSLDETMELFVRAHDGTPTADGQGHVNGPGTSVPVLSLDVVFDVAPPVHESTTVMDADDVYVSGETITLSSRWDGAGYELAADFSAVDSAFEPDDVTVTDSGTGRYTVKYTISSGNTLPPVMNAPVSVTATDRFERSVSDTSVTVTVEEGIAQSVELVIDVNEFNPIAGGEVTITLGSYAGAVEVSIFNMAGALVRSMEQDNGPVVWGGENDDGDLVASGVYFLWIRTDGGDAVRKVAVVK